MTKPQPWTMSLAWKGYWGGPYIKARSVNDGETSQDGEWYRRAEADKYTARCLDAHDKEFRLRRIAEERVKELEGELYKLRA